MEILVVSENGYGKRSDIDDYRVTNRGGKGVKTINITEKTGNLIAIKEVTDADDLMIINRSGIIIRMAVTDLRVMGRATQGVRLIKINEGDSIAAVTKVDVEEEGKEFEENVDDSGNEIDNGTDAGHPAESELSEPENN
jgi:DNA gyrase subunit A